ncbi:hypothetical protein M9Y10_024252 [Tritrichomonas musculus]|uniref:Uncharacterized protein n=1 Tax=Tritrichomonas musculus TaxID=1915356 RepID=A0ABR2GLC0_9EUKA
MDMIYKYVLDNIVEEHQILNLEETSLKAPAILDFDSFNEYEKTRQSELDSIKMLNSTEFSSSDIQFLLEGISQYNTVNKIEFLLKLKIFFIKNANPNVFQEFVEAMKSPKCIEDFSKVLLSSIHIRPDLISDYNQILFPNIAIKLMSLFPKITFPSLIIILSKTLKKPDLILLAEIKKLIEVSEDPYFYGIIIYRFAELIIAEIKLLEVSENPIHQYQLKLISPLEILLSKKVFKYPLKTISLISFSKNNPASFFIAFKKIFSILNEQVLMDPSLDDEDIQNLLSFIQLFVNHVSQFPQLCKEINIEHISSIISNNENPSIQVSALSILVSLVRHPDFQETYPIGFYIEKVEKISKDLPYPLRSNVLDIYTILAEVICVSSVNLLVTDFFVEFIFDFFGSDDNNIISKALNISAIIANKSSIFAEALENQISAIGEIPSYYEPFLEHLREITQPHC